MKKEIILKGIEFVFSYFSLSEKYFETQKVGNSSWKVDPVLFGILTPSCCK